MNEILIKLTEATNKGTLLELVIEDIFMDLNFSNVRRQKSGSQYGYDVIGYKDNQCWKAECKNLSNEATISDIAPKLVWHLDNKMIDRFVIVSVNGISNDLYHLLEKKLFSFPIEIWCEEFLLKLIEESPSALKRLNLTKSTTNFQNAKSLIFPPSDLMFDVVYSKGLPFSYDYFKLDENIVKAYSEVDFRLTALIINATNRTFAIQEIIVRTLNFRSTDSFRVLRQFKQKGNIEPLKITFTPKNYTGGEVQLNEGKILEVKSNSQEYVEFKLSQKCEPGYYELIFEINCIEGGRTFSLYSSVFPLHKKSPKNNIINLCVLGKYYDTPVHNILDLDIKTWQDVKREYPNCLKYLGPTMCDTVNDDYKFDTWKINLLKGKRKKEKGITSLEFSSTKKSDLLVDLKIPIEEKLYTTEDAFREVLKHHQRFLNQ